MNENTKKRLKQIEIENYIWIIYIIIIGLSYYGNYLEKDYFINKNINSKNKYQKINAFIFITLIIVYTYYEKDAITSFNNKNKSTKQKEYDNLILIASTMVLISGLIFLYIILDDKNLDAEIAFD